MNFDISGAAIYLRIPTGIPVLGDFVITETMVVSWLVMILITGFCIWLTRDLRVENISKRQAVAEMLVEQATNLVRNNTGGTKFDYLIPFVAALFTTSAVPLTEEQKEALKARLEKISNKTIQLTLKVDPQVVGGIRAELEGRQLDGTLQERLSGLRKKVTEIIV